jgi:hypothetical protein
MFNMNTPEGEVGKCGEIVELPPGLLGRFEKFLEAILDPEPSHIVSTDTQAAKNAACQ